MITRLATGLAGDLDPRDASSHLHQQPRTAVWSGVRALRHRLELEHQRFRLRACRHLQRLRHGSELAVEVAASGLEDRVTTRERHVLGVPRSAARQLAIDDAARPAVTPPDTARILEHVPRVASALGEHLRVVAEAVRGATPAAVGLAAAVRLQGEAARAFGAVLAYPGVSAAAAGDACVHHASAVSSAVGRAVRLAQRNALAALQRQSRLAAIAAIADVPGVARALRRLCDDLTATMGTASESETRRSRIWIRFRSSIGWSTGIGRRIRAAVFLRGRTAVGWNRRVFTGHRRAPAVHPTGIRRRTTRFPARARASALTGPPRTARGTTVISGHARRAHAHALDPLLAVLARSSVRGHALAAHRQRSLRTRRFPASRQRAQQHRPHQQVRAPERATDLDLVHDASLPAKCGCSPLRQPCARYRRRVPPSCVRRPGSTNEPSRGNAPPPVFLRPPATRTCETS